MKKPLSKDRGFFIARKKTALLLHSEPNPSGRLTFDVLREFTSANSSLKQCPARHPCLAFITLGVPLAPLARYAHRSSPSVGPTPSESGITHTAGRYRVLRSNPIDEEALVERQGIVY